MAVKAVKSLKKAAVKKVASKKAIKKAVAKKAVQKSKKSAVKKTATPKAASGSSAKKVVAKKKVAPAKVSQPQKTPIKKVEKKVVKNSTKKASSPAKTAKKQSVAKKSVKKIVKTSVKKAVPAKSAKPAKVVKPVKAVVSQSKKLDATKSATKSAAKVKKTIAAPVKEPVATVVPEKAKKATTTKPASKTKIKEKEKSINPKSITPVTVEKKSSSKKKKESVVSSQSPAPSNASTEADAGLLKIGGSSNENIHNFDFTSAKDGSKADPVLQGRRLVKPSFFSEIDDSEDRANKKKYSNEVKGPEKPTASSRRKSFSVEESAQELEDRLQVELEEEFANSMPDFSSQICTKCGVNVVAPEFTIDKYLGYCFECADLLNLGNTKEARKVDYQMSLMRKGLQDGDTPSTDDDEDDEE
jgi:hypothetical protein